MSEKEVKRSLLLFFFGFIGIFSLILISLSFVSAAICGGNVPCNCGDTITSSRTLNESDVLTNCPADGTSGIYIGADNIFLDCAGYKINQSTPDGGSAVNNQGYDNVTIKNCILENFYRTILFQGDVYDSTIYNNTISDSSGYGIDMEQGPQSNNISNNIISNSNYMGLFMHNSHYNTIQNNTITGSPRGIQVTIISSGNVIVDNTFCRNSIWDVEFESTIGSNNTGDNICNNLYTYGDNSVTCSRRCPFTQGACSNIMTSDVTLTQNISDCSGNGIIMGTHNVVLDCNGYSIAGTGSYGILNEQRINVTIKNCNIFGFSFGIFFNTADNGKVSYNNVSRGSFGIGFDASDNGIINNNRLIDGIGSGILFNSGSHNNTVYENIASKNELYGLDLGSSYDNNISSNDFCFNAERAEGDVDLSSSAINNYGANLFGEIYDGSEGSNPDFVKSGECIVPEFVQGQCNQVVNSNITLTEDIVNCTSNYILRVFANDITIDCNGHTLSGVGREDDGIRNIGHSGVTIKNCMFQDFEYGIYDYNEGEYAIENSTFENNTFENNDYGISLAYFSENNISNNQFISNGVGLEMKSYSSNSTIAYNNFSSNSEYALYAEVLSSINIRFNNFDNNWYGVYFGEDANNNLILDNNFTGNYYGFYLYWADNNQIGRNYINSSYYNFGDSGSSCPLLYSWNGTSYTFISDMSTEGKLSAAKLYPDDYLKIDGNNLQPLEGKYNLQVTEEYDEISYIDQLKLFTIDHSPDVDVFNGLTRVDAHSIYTVSKTPSPVHSCTDALGNDCLEEVSEKDGLFTMSPVENISNTITLDLGDLTNASEIKLIISYSWVDGYSTKNSSKSVQVKDASGNWVSILSNSDLTTRAALQKTYVLNLTDKFLTDDYAIRFVFPIQSIDYLAIDTTPQQEVSIKEYDPLSADLHYRGYSNFTTNVTKSFFYNQLINQSFSTPFGEFTKYGDVLSLVNSTDDIHAIVGHGDEISLSFQYDPILEGKERDFLMFEYAYYKPASLSFGKKVEPLPFRAMTKYPYNESESYPNDEKYKNYLSEYNTRRIASSRAGGALPYGVNNSVFENTIVGSGDYNYDYGLYLYDEEQTTIINNNISQVYYGIYIDSASGLNISYNNISEVYTSLYLTNVADSNILWNNLNSFDAIGVYFTDYNEDNTENTFSNNNIYADLTNDCDTSLYDSGDCAAIQLEYSYNNNFENNYIEAINTYGIGFSGSGYNNQGNIINNNTINVTDDYDNSYYALYMPYYSTSSCFNTILHNRFYSDYWVYEDCDESSSELNYYNDSYSGNIYYLADGTPSWEFLWDEYDLSMNDTNRDGWADEGTAIPFNSSNLPNSLYENYGADWHPALTDNPSLRSLEVELVSPMNNANFSAGDINFVFNPTVGWEEQEIEYCNLSVYQNANLLGLWHFDGDVIDSSLNSNDGTVEGGEYNFSDYKFGNASYYFDGSSEGIVLEDNAVFTSIDNFTVSAWIKLSSYYYYSSIFAFGNGGDEFLFYTNIGGQVCQYQFSNCGDTSLSLNQWYHIAAVRNGDNVSYYVNGVFDGSGTGTAETIEILNGFRRLGADGGNEDFNGSIDDLAIWDRALSVNEIYDLYLQEVSNPRIFTSSSSSIITNQNNSLSLSLSSGDYTWDVSCSDDAGLNGTSGARSLTINGTTQEQTAQEEQNSESQSSSGGYASQTYFGDSNFQGNGNNFNLRYHDKINFTVNLTNHTLTLNHFNSTTAEVLIQSEPIIAYLEKGILYELDVNKDGRNDLMVRYEGLNKNLARIFIQEILPEKSSISDTKKCNQTNLAITRNSIFYKILISIIIVGLVLIRVLYKHHRKKRYSCYGY